MEGLLALEEEVSKTAGKRPVIVDYAIQLLDLQF